MKPTIRPTSQGRTVTIAMRQHCLFLKTIDNLRASNARGDR
jgi:hypothetical protein